ncbi:MAG: sialidase family protein [Ginsengibacter sp.]
MMKILNFQLVPVTLFVLCFSFSLRGQLHKKGLSLKAIYEPVFVGRPSDNAFNGLVRLPGGEIRHYGFAGNWDNPSSYFYICSKDNGLHWNKKIIHDTINFTGENMPPPVCSPHSGDFIRLISNSQGTFVLRSQKGIDGSYQKILIDKGSYEMVRQPIFLSKCRRMLVTCQKNWNDGEKEILQSCVFYSDDDGYNWKLSEVPVGPYFKTQWPHAKSRWQNYAVEPTIAELKNGRLWMLLRTSMDNLYESFSEDNGAAWTIPLPSRFYATLTMPTFFRLKDGRLMLFECNTTPLPEVDRSADTTISEQQKTGVTWEDVFTNRDAIHAAISEDDGKTWIGFRELYLNPLRNDSNFATSGGKELSLDKSVQQSQAVELPYGKVLVAFGQHPLVRAMIIFDPAWLYENSRSDNFARGLRNWSTFKYIDGIKGHCAYNRDSGPPIVKNPSKNSHKVLNIRRSDNPALVCQNDGAVWNFPAGLIGSFTTRIFLKSGGMGGRISLIDRWFNPTDTLAYRYAMYSLTFTGNGNIDNQPALRQGKWHELNFKWDNLLSGNCQLKIDGKIYPKQLHLNLPSENGISYVHFQSIADKEDKKGFFIESVSVKVDRFIKP